MGKIKVVINGRFNCQTYPLTDKAIEIEESDLQAIGITKCFDVENNCVIDYNGISIEEQSRRINAIIELKNNLARTDYQAIKHSEGLISEEEYAPIKAQRQAWRDEINQLEQQ